MAPSGRSRLSYTDQDTRCGTGGAAASARGLGYLQSGAVWRLDVRDFQPGSLLPAGGGIGRTACSIQTGAASEQIVVERRGPPMRQFPSSRPSGEVDTLRRIENASSISWSMFSSEKCVHFPEHALAGFWSPQPSSIVDAKPCPASPMGQRVPGCFIERNRKPGHNYGCCLRLGPLIERCRYSC